MQELHWLQGWKGKLSSLLRYNTLHFNTMVTTCWGKPTSSLTGYPINQLNFDTICLQVVSTTTDQWLCPAILPPRQTPVASPGCY